ncbi:MAG: transporter [Flavobacteriaceae bacterium]|nr:transporter [Flavobacteriaceae bacterium]|tara:strand:- start:28612 stop:29025 length:414 start_codon:yes stop_codon:yes gene_type:complete
MKYLIYLLIGTFFGIVMYKSEAASWFRIYEMFRFGSFHMFGVIGSALLLGIIGVQIIKRKNIKTINRREMQLKPKNKSIPRYLFGGIIFGLGWALAGACPGPMFVVAGAGYLPIIWVILGALLGTLLYGILRDKLPH